jgi:predicted Zn-dependent protease with MMP-like domain
MAPPNDDDEPDGPDEPDELGSHLDRGWALLGKNDLGGARISAEAALQLDKKSPDALTLFGAVCAAEGQDGQAVAHYRKAIKADPEAVAPLLYLAELLVWPKEEYDEALRLIDRALDLAEEEDDFVDAVLLKAETLFQAEADDDEIRAVMEELPPVTFAEASFHVRAGRLWVELEEDGPAEVELGKALEVGGEDGPEVADIWHLLGLVYEMREDRASQVKAWLKVRELDLAGARPSFTLSEDEFEKVAEETLAELPERIRSLLTNVPIVAGDYPSQEIVAEGNDPRMLGFFSGIPYPEKTSVGSLPHLDCVFLYQRNIERVAHDAEEVAREIRITLLHETGHFFGLSEEELEAMGLG